MLARKFTMYYQFTPWLGIFYLMFSISVWIYFEFCVIVMRGHSFFSRFPMLYICIIFYLFTVYFLL